uniref:Uncharacterized protein n=1 Tax=Candidatus Methanophaga sp. ANME-1 ERB7 TaxID=2759913 RepID=A0A7G9ZCG3_9EURY|nr:hypothetical protein LHHCGPCL_00012 [Methanosarcinales archaeon ANME-1 ERB7]
MDYETALKTCSEEVQVAIKSLEKIVVRFERRKYSCGNALYFYVLSTVNSPLLKEFLDASKREEFWLDEYGGFDGLFYDPYLLWYLPQLGLKSNEYFKEALEEFIKRTQTREGRILLGGLSDTFHSLSLRVLVSVEPGTEATDLAVRYFLDNLDEFKNPYSCDFDSEYSHLEALAIGVLALCELDYLKFKETVEDLCMFLKSKYEQGVPS